MIFNAITRFRTISPGRRSTSSYQLSKNRELRHASERFLEFLVIEALKICQRSMIVAKLFQSDSKNDRKIKKKKTPYVRR